jgi:hypothetical protein
MRNRVLITLALIATAVVGPAGAAHAQCGPPQSVEESLARTEVAFIGEVVDRSNRDRTAEMRVIEVWKGRRLPATVTVNGGPSDSTQQTAIDRTFLLGQFYLVIPANSRAPFLDSLCSGTQLWSTPDGTIPDHLQLAVGNSEPIPILSDGPASGPSGGMSGALGNLGVAAVVLGIGLGLVFIFKLLSSSKPRSKRRPTDGSHESASTSPAAAFKTRRRRGARLSMPGMFDSKRGSRLDQVRKATRRGRKGPGEHEKEQLARAVKLTATTPPSRRNHYTSGRRSAP